MIIPFKPIILEDANIFSLENIHEKYWDDFCKACYSRLGFSNNKEIDSERFKLMYTSVKRSVSKDKDAHLYFTDEEFTWSNAMRLRVNRTDMDKFRMAIDFYRKLKNKDHAAFPMLLVILRMQQSISKYLYEEIQMLDYLLPSKYDYINNSYDKQQIAESSSLIFDTSHIKDLPNIEKNIIECLKNEPDLSRTSQDFLEGIDLEGNSHHIWTTQNVCSKLMKNIINRYNKSLTDFEENYVNIIQCKRGNAIHAIVYRLFVSYLNSFGEVETMFKNAKGITFEELQSTRLALINEFKRNKLGAKWYEFFDSNNGLFAFANYFIDHRENYTTEDEERFFYLLDEIGVITDIIVGKANKYWSDVAYSEESINGSSLENGHVKISSTSFLGIVKCPGKEDIIIKLIKSYMKNAITPKDVLMPIRAAMDAGVLRRPSWNEFCSVFGDKVIKSKSSLTTYTGPGYTYIGASYNELVKKFKELNKC